MPYKIKRVDGRRSRDLIMRMHDDIFGPSEKSTLHDPATEGWWWIAYDEAGVPAGFCALTQNHPRTGYLHRSVVYPQDRGHGLQRRMIRVRERFARKQGWWRLRSDTCDSPHSVNNLVSSGYRNILPANPWGLKRSVYWQKIIGVK